MDRHDAIFIHIPKAAGTSIIKSLAGRSLPRDHASWHHFLQVDKRRFYHYSKFTFVRNPWDRAVSLYNYLSNGGNQSSDLKFSQYFKEHRITFEKFVMEYLNEYKIHEHILLRPQYLFVCDDDLNLKVDYLGYFENIDHDFSNICKILGVKMELTKQNSSGKNQDYKEFYHSQELIERIEYLYLRDVELFNYSF
ncbi:sulfotransferase family 2 domain-containing protein [Thiohalophilus sp.]|uniref:sulfotransferase family 2 domain-containing protein n=1 Tax=Thiohalophilus sp. TaxID=3028392 RepID=UPI002ACED9F8|nr:sulfotransferase family 2 domain-containing protein [Thiohalophilus sp.]MDZ7663578.1 sulfotransferase family 2 domain-containing protein [Thiohalophilus sp.]